MLVSIRSAPRRGASALSYGLIIGLVAVVAIAAVDAIGVNLTSLFGTVDSRLQGIAGTAEDTGADGDDTTNQPPSDLSLTPDTIVENAGADAVVGTLSAIDPDPGQSVTFTLGLGGGDEALFSLSGAAGQTLLARQSFDFESAQTSFSIEVIATDNGSPARSTSAILTLSVLDDPSDGDQLLPGFGEPCPATLTASDIGCTEGSGAQSALYVGDIAGGGGPLFLAPDDQSAARFSGGSVADNSVNSVADGAANIASFDLNGDNIIDGDFNAAQACANRSGGEWYLPARDEAEALWLAVLDLDDSGRGTALSASEVDFATDQLNFDLLTDGGLYWTSTDFASPGPQGLEMNGNTTTVSRGTAVQIRCVRRRTGPSGQPLCPSPLDPTRGVAPSAGGPGCDDGSGVIYAGAAPDGGAFYVAACDIGMSLSNGSCSGARSTLAWSQGSISTVVDTALPNFPGRVNPPDSAGARNGEEVLAGLTQGVGVTEYLATIADADAGESGFQPHQAALACHDLTAHGQDDWYLPAIGELDVIYANLAAVDDAQHPLDLVNDTAEDSDSGSAGPLRASFVTSGTVQSDRYWSSTERGNGSNAWPQQMGGNGNQGGNDLKTNAAYVRCARR